MVVLGFGFLIAWGLNQLIQKRRATEAAAAAKATETAAADSKDTLPTPPPSSDVQVVAIQPTSPGGATTPAAPELVPTSVAAGPVVQNLPPIESTPRSSAPANPVPAEPVTAPVIAAEPPRPTEPPVPTPAPRVASALQGIPAATPPPAVIDTNLKNPENALIKQEVLKRIDLMPDLSPENRQKLYERVDRTPGMGRVATIFFDIGESRMRPADVERLRADLSSPAAQRLVEDPTVVLVVLGYADPSGGADLNKQISQNRANNAVSALRDRLKLANIMHSVAMGSSTLFGDGRDQLQKNRVVEVWAVMP
jgi:outer membrane protein OmpA-like peptidoglycan-associated protein